MCKGLVLLRALPPVLVLELTVEVHARVIHGTKPCTSTCTCAKQIEIATHRAAALMATAVDDEMDEMNDE